MANRILRIAQAVCRGAWPHVTAALQPRCFTPLVFSRALSAMAAAPEALVHGVDMSSTVTEMRDFARLHGISLKGLRLKSDVFAAIQMHFGVFVKVHAGAHSECLTMQENMMVNAEPVADEEINVQLKVRLPFAVATPAPMLVSASAQAAHSLVRLWTASSLKILLHPQRSSPSGAFCQ
jgi:hypothetical protein